MDFSNLKAILDIVGAIGLAGAAYSFYRSNLTKSTIELLKTRADTLDKDLQDAKASIAVLTSEVAVLKGIPLEAIAGTLEKVLATQNTILATQNSILSFLESGHTSGDEILAMVKAPKRRKNDE